MKLFFSKGACSLAPRIAINELELTAQFISVDLKSKKTADNEDFYKINPKGAVPVIQLDTNEILTENAIILTYLADENPSAKLLPLDDLQRYHALEWLNFVATDMHKGVGVLFNQKLTPEVKETVFIPLIKTKLKYLDSSLAEKKYLMGDLFTLADIYLFVILRWVAFFKIDTAQEYPNVYRYFNDLKERKSIKQSLEQENISS